MKKNRTRAAAGVQDQPSDATPDQPERLPDDREARIGMVVDRLRDLARNAKSQRVRGAAQKTLGEYFNGRRVQGEVVH